MSENKTQEEEISGLTASGSPSSAADLTTWHRIWSAITREWTIRVVAFATFASGLFSIFSVLLTRFHESPRLFNMILPFGVYHWGRSLTLVLGFGLIYFSFQILRRRQIAWWLTVIILSLLIIAHLVHGFLWYATPAPAITLILMILLRRRFTVRTEPTSLIRGLVLVVLVLSFALIYGTIGFWLLDTRDFGLNFSISDALVRTLREFTLIGNNDLIARTHHASWFLDSLNILGITAAILAALSLFRPLAYRLRTVPLEREQAANILKKYGTSSLDFFKLWPDKSFFFSEDSGSFIAYKVGMNVAVSLGDPTGREDELESLTHSFIQFCTDNNWGVAFHQVLPDNLPVYRRLGLHVLKIGEDAVIDLERFCSTTMEEKAFRYVRRRFETGGYTTALYIPPHPPELLDEVEMVSKEWLLLPGRRERGFTLGSFDKNYLKETPLFVLKEADMRIIAFVNEIPSYRQGEATIDLMRHLREIPNGTMDYLLIKLFQSLRHEGYTRFSLGLAPFAGVGEKPGATLQEQAIHQVYEHLNRMFSYKGLRNYKAKFEPVWEERFLVYQRGPANLLRVSLALIRVTER
jgi:phosphatidylglycerol lysyltransferase